MGCTISAPDPFLHGSIERNDVGNFYLDHDQAIALSCSGEGRTLLSNGVVVQGGVYPFTCPNVGDNDYDFSFLTCSSSDDEPSPRSSGPIDDANNSSDDDNDRTTTTTVVVKPPDLPQYVDCPIPMIEGVVGYQAASDVTQASIVRHPISIIDGTTYYNVHPHETVIFVCEDSSNHIMKYDGMVLEPHSVQFYAFHCLVEKEDDSPEENQQRNFILPLSCSSTNE